MKELAEHIARDVFNRIEPELHKAMIEKIIAIASDKWRYQFLDSCVISKLVDDAIVKALNDKYKPVLEYIADKKARDKVLKRAEQNGIPTKEIVDLFSL